MGNARWAGVGLARLLRAAGVKREAVQVTFDGLDEGPLASVPDFVKALDIDHALQPEVTVAYSMNGEPLPALNGFPARLVVPGWYATYWVKALHRITVLPHRLRRVLDGQGLQDSGHSQRCRGPAREARPSPPVPINRMNVRSFVTTPEPGARRAGGPGRRGRRDRLRRRQRHPERRSLGRRRVDLGCGDARARTWGDTRSAAGAIDGHQPARGEHRLRSRATAGDGQVQPDERRLEPRRVHAKRRRGDDRPCRLNRPMSTNAGSGRDADASHRQRFGLVLTFALGLIAAAVAYVGTRDTWVVADRRPERHATAAPSRGEFADPAWDIELPDGSASGRVRDLVPDLPLGPASPRSAPIRPARSGPRSSTRWWPSTGRPLTAQDEAQVVDYLLAVRPPAP